MLQVEAPQGFAPPPYDDDRHRPSSAARGDPATARGVRADRRHPCGRGRRARRDPRTRRARAGCALPRARAARDRRGRRRQARGAGSRPCAGGRGRDDDRRAPALPAGGRPSSAPDGGSGGRAREADRARRHAGEAAHDPVESPPRRLDREELSKPGTSVSRSDPGRDARPDPSGREVRLAPWLQVLDLRHVVDPPGRGTSPRRQGADDPDAGAHRRATPEDESRRAHPLDATRPRAEARGDRRGGLAAAATGDRGARGRPGLDEPRPTGRRDRGRGVRRLRGR